MRFFALLMTVFIDSLGFGLVFPILSPLIMDPAYSILPGETSVALRGFVFGVLVSAFCIGQFFGGPILGALSDRKGRKKVLVLAIWLGVATYLLAGLGVIAKSVTLIFIARLIGGSAAANWSIAQSIIVDQSSEADKAKNFGLLGMAWGTGFIIGPYLGGKLSDPTFFSWCGLIAPFWVAAAFSFFNVLMLIWRLEETLPANQLAKVSWLAGIGHLRKAFTTPKLRSLFSVMFVFCLGWGVFTEFSPIFLMRYMGYQLGEIANFYAWIGLWIAIGQGILIRPFVSRFSPQKILPSGLLGMGLIFPLMLLARETWMLFLLIPLFCFFESLIFPSASTLVSNLSPKEAQGEILGIHNSVQWAAIGIAPFFSGSAIALFPHLPVTFAFIAMMVATALFFRGFLRKQGRSIEV